MPSIPNECGLTAAPSRRDQVAAPDTSLLLQRVRSRAARHVAIGGVAGSWRFTVLAAWQSHREDRTLARFARHGHVAAHHARELAREGKAVPRPAVAPRGQGIRLSEFLKQL